MATNSEVAALKAAVAALQQWAGSRGRVGSPVVLDATRKVPASQSQPGGGGGLTIGTTAGTAAEGNDSRLFNARTPIAHASNHESGGTDQITLAQAQVTGLGAALTAKADASALTSGLALKADASAVTASLALKADTTALTAGLATKSDTTHTHAGGGSLTATGVDVTLSSTPARAGRFTITTTGLTTGRPVLVSQAAGPYVGKGTLADEAQMDAIRVAAKAISATVIECQWTSQTWIRGSVRFDWLAA
jgi:hypothetical protein